MIGGKGRLVLRAAGGAMLAIAATASAQASDGPPQPYQDIQLVQSALDVLGYYDGPIDGAMDAPTRAALERFAVDSIFPGDFAEPNPELIRFVGAEAMPAVARGFGTDPTGIWDVDLSHLSADEAQALMDLHQWPSLELCSSPLAIQFQGMAYGTMLYGIVAVVALQDGMLVPVPDPDAPDATQPAFTFVDKDTMQRVADGTAETWHRCR